MSTRSGPYEVVVNGATWTWEHDMYQRQLLDWETFGGDTIRIWSPMGFAIETSFVAWEYVRRCIPVRLVFEIENRYHVLAGCTCQAMPTFSGSPERHPPLRFLAKTKWEDRP